MILLVLFDDRLCWLFMDGRRITIAYFCSIGRYRLLIAGARYNYRTNSVSQFCIHNWLYLPMGMFAVMLVGVDNHPLDSGPAFCVSKTRKNPERIICDMFVTVKPTSPGAIVTHVNYDWNTIFWNRHEDYFWNVVETQFNVSFSIQNQINFPLHSFESVWPFSPSLTTAGIMISIRSQ